MNALQSQTIQITLPKADVPILRNLASDMGWTFSTITTKKKCGIEKGLEDIRKENIYYAKDSQDLIMQIL